MIKFSKSFKPYLSEDAVYNFINSMLGKSKYYRDVMEKHFKKELVMTKKDNEHFENSTKCQICDNAYVDNDVKVRDHCHIIGKYRGSVRKDCNIKVKLNYKIHIVFHNLKNYGLHLIIQELGRFNFKINVIPNGLEKYMIFDISDKLVFSESFQF